MWSRAKRCQIVKSTNTYLVLFSSLHFVGAESPGALEDKDKHKITDYSEESDLFTVESFVGARNLRKCVCVCVCVCVFLCSISNNITLPNFIFRSDFNYITKPDHSVNWKVLATIQLKHLTVWIEICDNNTSGYCEKHLVVWTGKIVQLQWLVMWSETEITGKLTWLVWTGNII